MSEDQSPFQTEDLPDALADPPLADKAAVKRVRKTALSSEKDRDATLKGLMSLPEGRRWMWWLLGECHVGMQPAHIVPQKGSVDVPRSFMNFGEMNVGLKLIGAINRACPEEYVTMAREAAAKEQANA